MLKYNTSIRIRPIEETLKYAKIYALKYGITRVTDTTRLDTIGIPVFASIRPGAMRGSLCVSAGKGVEKNEARIGAYMEALELALAEPNVAGLEIIQATVQQVLDGAEREEAILDFCPILGIEIPLAAPIQCIEATDLLTGKKFLVPAELVFFPYRTAFPNETSLFGAHTNGLSSGNSVSEATVHGLLEVLERDIISFLEIQNHSQRVIPESYPDHIKAIEKKVQDAGLRLMLRYAENRYGIPFFWAHLIDPMAENPIYVCSGYGCHTEKSIAALRAVTEAIQSRLTTIHGSRDDLIDIYTTCSKLSPEERKAIYHKQVGYLNQTGQTIDYHLIGQPQWQYASVEDHLLLLLDMLREKEVSHVLRVAYTQADEPLQVVKIIIPGMEFFTSSNKRIGPRLQQFINEYTNNIIRRSQPD